MLEDSSEPAPLSKEHRLDKLTRNESFATSIFRYQSAVERKSGRPTVLFLRSLESERPGMGESMQVCPPNSHLALGNMQ